MDVFDRAIVASLGRIRHGRGRTAAWRARARPAARPFRRDHGSRGPRDGADRPCRHERLQSDDLSARLELLGPAAGRPRALLQGNAAAGWQPAARIRARRGRSRDRDRARHVLSGLDLQRPGARPDDPRTRRGPRSRHLPQSGNASPHHPFPRLASARDGRLAAGAPGAAGREVRLRVRRRAVRACTSITATRCR